MSLLNHRKAIGGTAFVIDIKNVENLENLALRLAFTCFRHSPHDAKSADFPGQQVNNDTVVAIFHSSEYYAACFFQHNRHKSTKIQ